jgi:hypothetical protein
MARVVFNKNKTLVTCKLGLNLRKTLVKCYSVKALHCAEAWKLRKVDRI